MFVRMPVILQDGWTLDRGVFSGPEAACYLSQGDIQCPGCVALSAQTRKVKCVSGIG